MRIFALLICGFVLATAPHLRAAQQLPSSALLVLHDAGRQLTLIDGESGKTLGSRPFPAPLDGPPQVSPDKASVYWGTPQGDVVRLALPRMDITAQAPAKVGPGTPLLALSSDGRWLLAAGARQARVQILDAALQPERGIPIATPDGREQSRAAQVLNLAGQRSWVLALDALRELWEISYDPDAPPIYDGLVHDYRMGEALPRSGFLGVRRIPVPAPLPEVLVPESTRLAVGSERCLPPAPCTLRLMHLNTRSQIAAIALEGTPRPGASAAWTQNGQLRLALAGLEHAAAPLLLPRLQPETGALLPAHARRILHSTAALWLQRANGAWLKLHPDSLQPQAEIDATPQTRLLMLGDTPVLVTPGVAGSLSLRDPATLRERLRLPFSGLQGAWAINP